MVDNGVPGVLEGKRVRKGLVFLENGVGVMLGFGFSVCCFFFFSVEKSD